MFVSTDFLNLWHLDTKIVGLTAEEYSVHCVNQIIGLTYVTFFCDTVEIKFACRQNTDVLGVTISSGNTITIYGYGSDKTYTKKITVLKFNNLGWKLLRLKYVKG